jgi:hypothetical protein
MMGLMDNELTPKETADLNLHMVRCETCRKEFDALCQSHSKLNAVSYYGPADNELDRIWKSPFSRFTRNAGLLLVIIGWVALIIYALYEFLITDTEPVLPKIATIGIIIGFVVLLLAVLRDRIRTFKTDPYKEVKR